MNRRAAILALLALPLGQFNAYAVQQLTKGPALLTIDLAQWGGILVKWGPWQRLITPHDIQQALGKETTRPTEHTS